jgi:hypothetical protein
MGVQPMVLELVDAVDGSAHGAMNCYVEFHPDDTATLTGELRFGVEGFVSEATWTLRYAWKDRTKPDLAFRLPQVKELDPMSVVLIRSVDFDKGSLTKERFDGEA